MPSISRPLTIGVAMVVVLAALGGLALAQLRSRDMAVVVTEVTSADALSAAAEQSPSPAPPPPSPVQPSPSPTATATPSPSAAPTTSPPQPEPSATSTIEEPAAEPAPAVEDALAPQPEPVAPPPAESHPMTIRIERVGSYAWVYVSGSGCYGPNRAVGVGYRDESGRHGDADGGVAPPDGNWELKESLGGSATPPGRYTFRASCAEINGGPIVFSYDPQTVDWTG